MELQVHLTERLLHVQNVLRSHFESVDDKLKLLGGVDGFYTQAIPSISLKRLKMSDGPVGVRTFGPAPAYTAGVALAATSRLFTLDW